ncbi:Hpt domain-containing protein [Pelagibaculum spongiae]|uniref:Chemotaxis protein CheA n=1 Tax=Pelagibaculum spongiae TaxID=2080658 RepID=A0A2V1GYJ1_9GAMM|nr:Hpt domain-containing protein [Pelagibaculum spongiae]PVZ72161.1 hypothetical protein DC094_03870 [Pelagibaculum spongiae]
MADNHDRMALSWVKGEIEVTLEQAKASLESYVDNPRDIAQLRFCQAHLHQVQGTLQMLEFYGAALLAEEMESLTAKLIEDGEDLQGDACESLMAAMLQLPAHLERLQSGEQDLAVVLLPLLNDLRAARGEALLTENAVFNPDFSLIDHVIAEGVATPDAAQIKVLRHQFQLVLVAIFRNQSPTTALEKMQHATDQLSLLLRGWPSALLWEVAGGFLDVLREHGISASVKVLLGELDRRLRLLLEAGQTALREPAPEDLLKNLLYYIAKSRIDTPRIQLLREKFQLETALPSDQVIEGRREGMAGPDKAALQSIYLAISEKLSSVKDSLEELVHQPEEKRDLTEDIVTLEQVADTLAVVGLGIQREAILTQVEQLKTIAQGDQGFNAEAMMDAAGALLYVEATLKGMNSAGEQAEDMHATILDSEFQQANEQALALCREHLSEAKNLIIDCLSSDWHQQRLEAVPQLLHQVYGGLTLVFGQSAALMLKGAEQYISQKLLEPGLQPSMAAMEALADVLTGVEYYLDTCIEGAPLDFVLSVASERLVQLGYQIEDEQLVECEPSEECCALTSEQAEQEQARLPVQDRSQTRYTDSGEIEPDPNTAPAETKPSPVKPTESASSDDQQPVSESFEIDFSQASSPELTAGEMPLEFSLELEANSLSDDECNSEPSPASAAPAPALEAETEVETVADVVIEDEDDDELIDDELIEVFTEEAEEVLDTLSAEMPKALKEGIDSEALQVVRRAWHTLKGSGRMIGATTIGEFAWSIENMLNRALDKTIAYDDLVKRVANLAVDRLPDLIRAFTEKRQPDLDPQDLADQADAISRGERPEIPEAETDLDTPDEIYPEIEAELLEVFSSEAAGHLRVCRSYCDQITDPRQALVSDDLLRALHTLKGSAYMAGIQPIADLMIPLEALYREHRIRQLHLDKPRFGLLSDSISALESSVNLLEQHQSGAWDSLTDELRNRLDDALSELPEHESVEEDNQAQNLLLALLSEGMDQLDQALELCVEAGDGLQIADCLDQFVEHASAANISPAIALATATGGMASRAGQQLDASACDLLRDSLSTLEVMLDALAADQTPEQPVELLHSLELWMPDLAAMMMQQQAQAEQDIAAEFEQASNILDVDAEVEIDNDSANELSDTLLDDTENEIPLPEIASETQSEDSLLESTGPEKDGVVTEAPNVSSFDFDLDFSEQNELPAGLPTADFVCDGELLNLSIDLTEEADKSDQPIEEFTPLAMDFDLSSDQLVEADSTSDDLPLPSLEFSKQEIISELEIAPESDLSSDPLPEIELFDSAEELAINGSEQQLEIQQPEPTPDAEVSVEAEMTTADAVEPIQQPEPTPGAEVSVEAEMTTADAVEPIQQPEPTLDAEVSVEAEMTTADAVEPIQQPEPMPDTEISVEAEMAAADAVEPVTTPIVAKPSMVETLQPLADDVDPEIVEIFLEEAEEILTECQDLLEILRAEPKDQDALANLQRGLHTLKGGARMAAIRPMAELSHRLEDLYDLLAAGQRTLSEDLVELLEQGHSRLHDMADAVSANRQPEDGSDLYPLIEQGCAGEPITFSAAALKTPAAVVEVTEAETKETEIKPVDAENLAVEEASVATESEAKSTPISTPVVVDEAELVVSEPEAPEEIDHELFNVFCEESAELTQQLTELLPELKDDETRGQAFLKSLQYLHTLKGGARISAVEAMAEQTRLFESLMLSLSQFQLEWNDETEQLVEDSTLALAEMQKLLVEQKPVALDPRLIARLQALGSSARVVDLPEGEQGVRLEFREELFGAEEVETSRDRRSASEQIRLSADVLDKLVNLAGETSIHRARVEQQVNRFGFNLEEMDGTINRLKGQLRRLDSETEAQILYRLESTTDENEDFDPLEMDRYSRLQQLSRSLAESAADVQDLHQTLGGLSRDTETLLLQQGRVNSELQESLMRTRMVPFGDLTPRLRRIVRQITGELNKPAELVVIRADGEMDRQVLERMIPPFEHMLRNAIDHGLEAPEVRSDLKKPAKGKIGLELKREGGEVVISLSDDGKGMNLEAIRKRAIERGLMDPRAQVTDQQLLQFVLESGFSTANKVTQISGRGVGMDVVNSEIKQLGGNLEISSEAGKGTIFTIRLPFTVSVNRALMVKSGEEIFAVPLNQIQGVLRASPWELEALYQEQDPKLEYAGREYQLHYLGAMIDKQSAVFLDKNQQVPVLVVHTADRSYAIQVDSVIGSREIVVKSMGSQLAQLPGLSGATIMGDGSVVMILELSSLLRRHARLSMETEEVIEQEKPPVILVVDDSITVRKVTSRLLKRNGYEVMLAKDGMDAIATLHEHAKPDVMLLDIEMPRMDGFEVASKVRHDPNLADLPIIMITSRTGDKHRHRAAELGVNHYLGKPYQETELLSLVNSYCGEQ